MDHPHIYIDMGVVDKNLSVVDENMGVVDESMGVVNKNMGVVDENLGVVDRPSVGVVDEMGSSMGRRWVVDDNDFILDFLIGIWLDKWIANWWIARYVDIFDCLFDS